MSSKWLPDQLLDIFEKHDQIKDLAPAIVGKNKDGIQKLKDSPKFTISLKFILLAIAKYKECFLSMKTIAKISSLSRGAVIENLKILIQNEIVTIERRKTESGDNNSNVYHINMSALCSYFSREVVTGNDHVVISNDQVVIQDDHLPVDKSVEVVISNDHLVISNDYPSHPGGLPLVISNDYLVIQDDPIKQINNQKGLNNYINHDLGLHKNFTPSEECKNLSIKLGLDLTEQFEKFKNWHEAKGSKFSSWNAAFKTWLNRANEFKKPSIPQVQVSGPSRHYPSPEETRARMEKDKAEQRKLNAQSMEETLAMTNADLKPITDSIKINSFNKSHNKRDGKEALEVMRKRLTEKGEIH